VGTSGGLRALAGERCSCWRRRRTKTCAFVVNVVHHALAAYLRCLLPTGQRSDGARTPARMPRREMALCISWRQWLRGTQGLPAWALRLPSRSYDSNLLYALLSVSAASWFCTAPLYTVSDRGDWALRHAREGSRGRHRFSAAAKGAATFMNAHPTLRILSVA